MKWTVGLTALFLTSCASTPPLPKYDFSALDARLTAECATGQFAGITVVRVGRQEVYNKTCGMADVASQQPITRDRRFKIYSISKMLTAIAVMRMVELGKMELDAPAARYIPDLPVDWRPVTVRQLLQHSSGIPDQTEALAKAWTADHPTTMRIVLADAAKHNLKPAYAFGEKFTYSNFGYELLADAAARAAGQSFEQVMQEQIFNRAAMRTAAVIRGGRVDGKLQAEPDPRLVTGYNGEPAKLTAIVRPSFVQLGAGAVVATVDDMLALDQAIASGRLLSPASWKAMTTNGIAANPATGVTWGLGPRLQQWNGIRAEGHDGGNMGYTANFVRYPDHRAVNVTLTNRGYIHPRWISDAVAAALTKPATAAAD